MAYHDRQYSAYLVLGDPSAEALWKWERWFEVFRAFDPVVKTCRDKPLVRVSQYTKTQKREELKFGRLTWSPASFEKWVHGSPKSASSQDSEFFFAEVSAPSIPVAAREGQPPDFFLTLTNEGFITRTALAFNPRVFVAIATDMPDIAHVVCRAAIAKMETLVSSRLSAKITRPWGFSFGSFGGFQQAIQDIAHVGLFKIGPPHSRAVTLETLAEAWELLR